MTRFAAALRLIGMTTGLARILPNHVAYLERQAMTPQRLLAWSSLCGVVAFVLALGFAAGAKRRGHWCCGGSKTPWHEPCHHRSDGASVGTLANLPEARHHHQPHRRHRVRGAWNV